MSTKKTLLKPEPPKNILSPYFIFLKEHRERISKKFPNADNKELTALIYQEYKNLSEEYKDGLSREYQDTKLKRQNMKRNMVLSHSQRKEEHLRKKTN